MSSFRIFGWWFMLGALIALSVILIQGGIRDIIQTGEPLWNMKVIELGIPIIGGGLLAGCIALILNRLHQPDAE